MKTSKSFNQEYIEKAKTLIHEILEDKKEYDDWTQICFPCKMQYKLRLIYGEYHQMNRLIK
jgi:hypothetical protein